MHYYKYILKVATKNRLNLIPLIIPIAIMCFLMVMNLGAVKSTGYIPLLNDGVGIMEGALTRQKDILEEEPDLSEKDSKEINEANTALVENIKLTKESIRLAADNQWSKSLNIQLMLMEENEIHDINEGNIPDNQSFSQNTFMKYAAYKELSELNIEPQYDGLELKGTNFAFRMMDSIFPIIFMLCLIALISNIVSSSLIGRVDIESLFPENPITFQLKKILILATIGIAFYMSFIFVSFLFAAAINGVGSIMYPINMYSQDFLETEPIFGIMIKAAILQVLSIVFIISTVYLISIITRSALTTLFLSTIFLLGAILLTGQIAPLARFLHFFPTTYVNSISVVTNKLAYNTTNGAINLSNGVIVMIVWTVAIISVILIYKTFSRNKEMLIR